MVNRRLKTLGWCLLGGGILVLSSATPIFPVMVGIMLSQVGSFYGNASGEPAAYVVLGGGLRKTGNRIILNGYSQTRTYRLWQALQNSPKPAVLSGVEAPWMQEELTSLSKYTLNKDTPLVIYSENASMNTCENIRFTKKLLDYQSDIGDIVPVQHVYLISDWYHMARAQRQFALVGVATTPLIAPMPQALSWHNPKANLSHSRRAIYETIALIRDITKPQKNCRDSDKVSISMLKTPRKDVRTFNSY